MFSETPWWLMIVYFASAYFLIGVATTKFMALTDDDMKVGMKVGEFWFGVLLWWVVLIFVLLLTVNYMLRNSLGRWVPLLLQAVGLFTFKDISVRYPFWPKLESSKNLPPTPTAAAE